VILPLLVGPYPAVEIYAAAGSELRPGSAEELALIEIHRRIQSSALKVYLYQAAMSLWR
jgi:hypothetical protein